MKIRLKKACALGLSALMALSAAACGNDNGNAGTAGTSSTSGSAGTSGTSASSGSTESGTAGKTGQKDGTLTTITIYPAAGNISSGVVGGYKGEYFASLGFQLEVWAYSDEKTNALLASGDLPDIMYIPEKNRDVMIEAGMLLNLDGYLDQMPHAQSYEPLGTALNYVRQYKSAGTGSIYGLPTTVGESSTKDAYADSTERNALKLKWDVYEQIGAPEIKDVWGVIDVMEQMVEACPQDEAGIPYYGTILNNGSDTDYWACMTMFYRWQGFLEKQLPYMLETDMVHGTNTSILNKDSLYYEGLKWYNEVYRRGLMDPDSINNDRPTQKAKVDAGYAMIPSGYLPGWSPEFYEYYIPDTNIYYSYNSLYGGQLIGVNAKTENVDACLTFLDMLCDPDSYFLIVNGPENETWYRDEEGNAFMTDANIEHLKSVQMGTASGFILSTGEKMELWNTPWVVNSGAEISLKDGNGNYRIATTTQWKEKNDISSDIETFKKWQKTTGYETWKDWLNANQAFYSESPLDGVENFCTLPDDNLQLIVDALRDTVVTASWKMVYAENEEEFEKIWNKMVDDCEGLGAEDVIEWRLGDIENAKAIRDSLEQ